MANQRHWSQKQCHESRSAQSQTERGEAIHSWCLDLLKVGYAFLPQFIPKSYSMNCSVILRRKTWVLEDELTSAWVAGYALWCRIDTLYCMVNSCILNEKHLVARSSVLSWGTDCFPGYLPACTVRPREVSTSCIQRLSWSFRQCPCTWIPHYAHETSWIRCTQWAFSCSIKFLLVGTVW